MLFRRLLLLWITLALTGTALGEPDGTVSISLTEYLKLQASQQASSQTGPPMNALLSGATYRVKVDDQWANIDARVTLDVKTNTWQEVPLLASTAVLAATTLDGKAVPVYQKDGRFHLLTRDPGRHQLWLQYKLPLSQSGRAKRFDFVPLESPLCRVKFNLPQAGLKLNTNPPAPVQLDGKTAIITLPGGTDHITQLSWEPKAKASSSTRQVKLRAEVQTVAQISETAVRCTSEIQYNITGETDILRLRVPSGVEILEVEAAGISGWNVTATKGQQQIHVALSRPATGSLSLKVVYEKPVDNINATWELPWISADNVRSVKGFVAMTCSGSIEVTPAALEKARTVEPEDLPEALRQKAVLSALKYTTQPYHIALETRKGEEVSMITASIDSAEAKTLVTPDGKVVSTFTYQLRNNRKQYLEFKLPPGMSVWSAFVNGAACKPIETDSATVKLALVTSQNGEAFPVEITCVSQDQESILMGSQTFQAPSVDVPISNLKWTLFWPDQREVMQFDTDLQTLSVPKPQTTRSKRGFFSLGSTDSAAPAGESKREVADQEEASPAPSSRAVGSSADMGVTVQGSRNQAMMNMARSTSLGNFPVRVRVPEAGQPYTFQKLMVTNEMPTVTVRYFNGALARSLGRGTLLILLGLVLWLGHKRFASKRTEQK